MTWFTIVFMTKPDTPGAPLMTLRQAADALQTSERTIRRYLASGLITGVRVGPRLIRVHRDSVLKLAQPVGAR